MRTKRQAITHEQALTIFWGGVHAIAQKPFPWKCKCGEGEAYHVNQLWDHVRKAHKEYVIRKSKVKSDQLTI